MRSRSTPNGPTGRLPVRRGQAGSDSRTVTFRADYGRFLHTRGPLVRQFHDYDYHACHAASAFYASSFEKAVILYVDGSGDGGTTTGWLCEGAKLTDLHFDVRLPNAMGVFYTQTTPFFGFSSSGDEYHVMGLSAYGTPRHAAKLAKLVELTPDGYRLNSSYFTYQYAYALAQKLRRAWTAAQTGQRNHGVLLGHGRFGATGVRRRHHASRRHPAEAHRCPQHSDCRWVLA